MMGKVKKGRKREVRSKAEDRNFHLTPHASPLTFAIEVYDTTLRDGAQAEDVSFSAEDKVGVAKKLDELGVPYIEGGWPGANPKDIEFFRMIKTVPRKHATVVAFGSTRKASNPVQKDPNIQALLAADTSTITLFGKSWGFHVTEALSISLHKNLEIIGDSISFLREKGRRVFSAIPTAAPCPGRSGRSVPR